MPRMRSFPTIRKNNNWKSPLCCFEMSNNIFGRPLTLSLPRVINFNFLFQSSHYITQSFSSWMVGRICIMSLGLKGLKYERWVFRDVQPRPKEPQTHSMLSEQLSSMQLHQWTTWVQHCFFFPCFSSVCFAFLTLKLGYTIHVVWTFIFHSPLLPALLSLLQIPSYRSLLLCLLLYWPNTDLLNIKVNIWVLHKTNAKAAFTPEV